MIIHRSHLKIGAAALAVLLLAAAGSVLAAKGPKIAFKEDAWNFGKAKGGEDLVHEFVFKNDGDAALHIKNVETSCGCTAAKPSAALVAPGKSAEIQVSFDSSNFSGNVQKTVAMATNAGKSPNYTFKLEGNVVEALQVTPRQLKRRPPSPLHRSGAWREAAYLPTPNTWSCCVCADK